MSKTVMFIYGGLAHADWLESVARALRGTRLHDPRPARGLSKMCRSRSCGVPRVDRERRGLKSAASSAMATSRGPNRSVNRQLHRTGREDFAGRERVSVEPLKSGVRARLFLGGDGV